MNIKIEQPDLEICDFTNPLHCTKLCELIDEYIAHPMGGGEPLTNRQKLHLVDGLESHPNAIVLFVLHKEEIVGVINAFINFSTFACQPMINIHDLFVSASYRKKGLGRKLLQGIEDIAHQLKCAKITLEVRKDNEAAQLLYYSEGFDQGTNPMHFWTKYIK